MYRSAFAAGGVALLLAGAAQGAEPFAAARGRGLPAATAGGAPTMTLGLKPGQDARTDKTCWGWGWGGFYRPYFGGCYGFGCSPFYYGYSYYSPFYYSFYRPFYWWGCAGDRADVLAARPLGRAYAEAGDPYGSLPRRGVAAAPVPPADRGGPTYRYDGGPQDPVPTPGDAAPAPRPQPRPAPPPVDDGRYATLPVRKAAAPARRFEYPAYGEESARPAFGQDRSALPVARR